MSILDDLRTMFCIPNDKGNDLDAAEERIYAYIAAYDALAPTPEMWADAPAWVQYAWLTWLSGSRGLRLVWCYSDAAPTRTERGHYEASSDGIYYLVDEVAVPPGLDWREILVQRPHAA